MALTVYFFDSFSERSNFPQMLWKYNATNTGQTVVTGFQARNAPAGQAITQTDGGSHAQVLARALGFMSHWVVGIRLTPTLDGATSNLFLRFTSSQTSELDDNLANADTQLSAMYATDGTLTFYSGGEGTELNPGTPIYTATSGQRLASGVPVYLELDVTFSSTGGGWLTVMKDDVLFCSVSGVTIGSASPDRVELRFPRGFYGTARKTMQDVYVAESLLGPVKVTGWTMSGDSIPQGFSIDGSTKHAHNYQQVNEAVAAVGSTDVPDGDTTYVYNFGSAAVTDLYRPGPVACYGKILAVQLNITCRLITGSPNIQPLVRQAATRYDLGPAQPVPAGSILYSFGHGQIPPGTGDALYGQVQAITSAQPNGNGDWDDVSVGNADWGMRADTAGTFRVTGVTLEKLVSLRNVPYNCAGGSYSF